MRNKFKKPVAVEYKCGNIRSIYNGCPDRCPKCGAGVKT